MTSVTQGRLT